MPRRLFAIAAVLLCCVATAGHAQQSPAVSPTAAPVSPTYPSYKADLEGFAYPYPVKTFTFTSQAQNLTMAYMYVPARDGKPTVTLLHGKNFNGAYWKRTINFLQGLGYGVVVPDQIGFGKSSKPRNYQYSFANLASNTNQLLGSLGVQKTILVGHSMGGMLATRYALLYPAETQKLILVNPIGLENYLLHETYQDIATHYATEINQTPKSVITYQKNNYYDGVWNETYEELAQPLIGWVNGPDWNELAYVSALTTDMILTQPVVEEFTYLKVPTHLIIGTRDRTAPGKNFQHATSQYEFGRYDTLGGSIKRRNRNIVLTELKGLGHLPQVEDFSVFSETLRKALSN